jgi:hypothetical protein
MSGLGLNLNHHDRFIFVFQNMIVSIVHVNYKLCSKMQDWSFFCSFGSYQRRVHSIPGVVRQRSNCRVPSTVVRDGKGMESQDAPTRRGPTFNLLNPEG